MKCTSIPQSLYTQVQIQIGSTLVFRSPTLFWLMTFFFCMTFQAVQNHFIDCWDRFPFLYQIPRFYKQAIIHIQAICKLIKWWFAAILHYTICSRVNTLKHITTRDFSKYGNVFFFRLSWPWPLGFGVQTLDHVTSSSEFSSQFNFKFPPHNPSCPKLLTPPLINHIYLHDTSNQHYMTWKKPLMK